MISGACINIPVVVGLVLPNRRRVADTVILWLVSMIEALTTLQFFMSKLAANLALRPVAPSTIAAATATTTTLSLPAATIATTVGVAIMLAKVVVDVAPVTFGGGREIA